MSDIVLSEGLQNGDQIVIRAGGDHNYVSIMPREGDALQAVKQTFDAECIFTVVSVNAKVAFKASNGLFVSRINNGGVNTFKAVKREPDVFSQFTVRRMVSSDTLVPLLTIQADDRFFWAETGPLKLIEAKPSASAFNIIRFVV